MCLDRLLPVLALAAVTGCTCPAPPTNVIADPPDGATTQSARGTLRFKGPERLNNDFAQALELQPDQVCAELGIYQCSALVHNVALGGVDPYGPGLYEPSGITAVTTPLVVDRIAWSACNKRVTADTNVPLLAVIFQSIPRAGTKLADPGGAPVQQAIARLTQRSLLREPYASEVERYTQLARDIEATGHAEPAKAWMQAVCFAVLSSAESIFY